MNNSKLARQIVDELPKLVSGNVIDAGSAESLRRHYEPQIKLSRSVSIGLVITAILGGLLVGSGIILLLAHNWDALSRPMRAFVSVLPLLASIGLSGCTILRRMDSAAWREGCGVFWFLSIGASIALVSQTYHLYNDMAGFLFWWIVLTLPVIYLLNSGAAFAGCLACIVAYSFEFTSFLRGYGHISPKPFMLLALALPFYAWQFWRHRESLRMVWMSWALALALPLVSMMLIRGANGVFIFATGGLLGAVYYLAGSRWFGPHRGFRNPLRTLGSFGIAFAAFAFTYTETFEHRPGYGHNAQLWPFITIAALAWLALGADLLRRKAEFNITAALLPVLLALGILFRGSGAFLLLMNMYVLALGVSVLLRGMRCGSLFSMNQGLLLITALIVCRFFDKDYGFVARGVAFIFAGCGFLAANLLAMSRQRKQKEKKGVAS